MSLISFLSGSPTVYGQGLTQTSESLPDWFSAYQQNILGDAASFANQGPQNYQGPRVAGLSPLSTGAANTAAGQAGVGSGIAQQGVNQVNSALAQPNAYQAGSPYLSNAASGVGSALAQPNASAAASPYLNAAASPLASSMGQFMNPYVGSVINATDALSARNFNQNVLPGLQDQFTQAGQVYGGSRQGYEAALLGSQEQQNEQALNANLLNQGFNTALGGAEAQAGINSNLASTAANAANAGQNTALTGANITAGLGSTAGSLANAGQQTGIAGGATLGSLGTTEQNNALNQAQVQNQFGQQQQANTQANYNTGYQDYQQQYYSPLIGAQAMQGVLQGMPIPTGRTTYNYQPIMQGYSPLQVAGSTGTQLTNLLSPLFGGSSTSPTNISTGSQGGPGGYGMTGWQVAKRGGHIRLARGGPARRPVYSMPNRQSQWRPLALPHYTPPAHQLIQGRRTGGGLPSGHDVQQRARGG